MQTDSLTFKKSQNVKNLFLKPLMLALGRRPHFHEHPDFHYTGFCSRMPGLYPKKKKVRCCLVLPQVYQEALFFTIQILTQASCKVEQANPLQRPNLCLPNHLPSAWHTRGSASLSNGSKAIALPHYCVECQTANTPLSLSQFKQQIPGYLHCVVAPSNSFTYSLVSFSPSHPNARWKPK